MKKKICHNCGYIGEPIGQGAGSFFVDALIWMVFASFTLLSAFLPLLLVPLGWTIYHIIVYKSVTCPKCENFDMVSLNSRKGKQAQLQFHGKQEHEVDDHSMVPPLMH
jgi:hypothetical protein